MKLTYAVALFASLGIHAAVLLAGGFGQSANAPFAAGHTAVRVRLIPSIKSVAAMEQPQPQPAPIARPRVLTSLQFNSPLSTPLPSPQIKMPPAAAPIKAPQYVFQSLPSINAIHRDSDIHEQGVFTPAKSFGLNMPTYPPISRRRNEEGVTTIELKVSATGKAMQICVLKSSGHARLDRAAVKAVKASTFRPARRGQTSVASTKRIVFSFKLRDQ